MGSLRSRLAVAAALVCVTACSATSRASPATVVNRPSAPTSPAPIVGTTPATDQSRVLLIGDSTLLAVLRYNAFEALRGFTFVYDAESCRTLGVPSCGDPPVPTNAVEAISAAAGTYDMVVMMAGYDEWWTSFPASFDEVVGASRAKGAGHIVWLTYREGVGYTAPDGSTANEAFVKNNETLRAKIASGDYEDVVLADWFGYTSMSKGWLADDGIHLTRTGAFSVADYISRVIASVRGTPCPAPWEPGGAIDDPCPSPDAHVPVADVRALYP